ncbi:undecaprenyl-diphosphate phosphatase [Adhaeribacter pallidiroseus]|uniref:Undecaprenyl-diphosphatase n=1 Tax=Adhaeribacter pallidiroseus TaxID=2072847 RepID=A0A369QIE1_9BACT|nr:undecaprenyl-diphosphate phosphatase [Adhaeribacter pallidiroseus]RDC62996.1 Undecaprenyl-diphosphate phosphatase [Adhaeribacter pallidiroseus]
MSFWHAIILAIVEGLTEFLPVSSTGHMIIASSLMGITASEFTKMFTVNIQFGAILSVLVLYWKRFFQSLDFYKKLLFAFIPAVVVGFLLNDVIDAMLESVVTVAISLVLGGVVLLFVDKWFNNDPMHSTPSAKQAFIIGIAQCIAMIPGVSRSAASIIGGLAQGISRKAAAEFSFFLAIPTMLAAASYKFITDFLHLDIKDDILKMNTYKIQSSLNHLSAHDVQTLLLGNLVAFIVAMLAIKFFINFLTKYGFRVFGIYRIIVGALLLLLLLFGVDLSV